MDSVCARGRLDYIGKCPRTQTMHAGMHAGLLVAVFTRTTDFALRRDYRTACNTSRYNHRFFVGLPAVPGNPTRKRQGEIVGTAHHRVLADLEAEQRTYDDLVLLPYRDTYQDLMLKTVGMLRFAYRSRARTLVKIDEEFCLRPEAVPTDDPVYFGGHRFSGTEYTSQRGYDNNTAPYFSGNTYGLSRSLIRQFGRHLWDTAVLYEMFGSSSEDVDVGRLVAMMRGDIQHRTVRNLVFARQKQL